MGMSGNDNPKLSASSVCGPNSDTHAAVSAFAEVVDILDQTKRLSLVRGNNGGGGIAHPKLGESRGAIVYELG